MLKILRVLFVVVLFALLSVNSMLFLALMLILFFAIDLKNIKKINKKVLRSILLFNLAVTLSFFIMFFFKENLDLWYLLYINLKVYAITYFVTLFFSKVDMVQFFAFSRNLSYLLTITMSQIISYKKSFNDLKMAFKARIVKKVREREKGFILKVFEFFLNKAMQDAKEKSLAMRARGFFD